MDLNHFDCIAWRKVCLDQNAIVSYDPEVHPTTSMGTLPTLNLSKVLYNIPSKYGIGDIFAMGSSLPFPPLCVRPSNDMEEHEELRNPTFSSCTVPLLVYVSYPYNPAETFRFLLDKLVGLQEEGFFDRRVTLVPGVPPGTRVPSYTKFWLGALSDRAVVSLSELSARKPGGSSAPSNATWEGRHIRCFEKVVGCKMEFTWFSMKFFRAGQRVVQHYTPQYLARWNEIEQRLYDTYKVRLPADPSVFKLVFVSRTPAQQSIARRLLNQQELLDRCNNAAAEDLPPPEWGVPYKSYLCFSYMFGNDLLMDLWLMRQVDGIFGVHGAGLVNAMFQKPGGSVLEVRPRGFDGNGAWPNRYARAQASSMVERPWSVFWYGIDTYDSNNSEIGEVEKERKPFHTGNPIIHARDRHVRVPWPSFRNQLLNMASVARTHDRYMQLRLSGAYYLTDRLTRAEEVGKDLHVTRPLQRNLTTPEEERRRLIQIPVSQKALDSAAARDSVP